MNIKKVKENQEINDDDNNKGIDLSDNNENFENSKDFSQSENDGEENQESFKLDNEAENNDENVSSLNEEEINKIIQQKFKALGKNLPETSNPPPQSPLTQLPYTQPNINTTTTPPLLQNTPTPSPVQYPPQFFPYQPFPYCYYIPQPQITTPPQQNTQPTIPATVIDPKCEQELMMLKIKNSNLESENEVLKQKLNELLNNSSKGIKENTKQIQRDNIKVQELQAKIDNLKISNKKENNEWRSMISQLKSENDDLKTEISIKKEAYLKIEAEKERLTSYIDQLKNDLVNMKKKISKIENENDTLFEEKSLIERKVTDLEKKNRNLNEIIKEMKNDYEVLNQNYYKIKKENASIRNEIENSKEENYFFKNREKEVKIHNRKVQMNDNHHPINRKVEQHDDEEEEEDNKPKGRIYRRDVPNSNRYSSNRTNPLIDLKNQISIHKNNISQLLQEKSQLENELFKIPQSQKTLKDKKLEVQIEESIDKIDKEINLNKKQIRELTNELNNL